MALTKTITKIMPTMSQIGVHLKLTDDAHPITAGTVVVIDEDVTDNYSIETGPTTENRAEVAKKVQAEIDNYKKLKAMYSDSKYSNAVTWIDQNTNV